MRKPLVATLAALVIAGAGAAPAVAAPEAAAPGKSADATVRNVVGDVVDTANKTVADLAGPAPAAQAVNFAGTVSLSNCSGSVVRMPDSEDNDPALVMTNGHCLETGFPTPGQVIVDRASTRTFGLLNSAGTRVGTLRASKIAYGTMTDTDMAVYQLTTTYTQIKSTYGIDALVYDTARPTAGTAISVVSGYWKRIYTCGVDGFAYRLKEGDWTWKDSIRYTSACNTIGGTSGSPVVNVATNKVVGVNNTGNESGERCTVNNPCEVDANGTVTVRQGINYAQQTWHVPACFGVDNKLDLSAAGCVLPKP
ncbi:MULTISPECIES: trypsin-like peptidase domain-containing protein [Streptomyces]|uniref:Trypsin-like peptidase domain-containing protein n=1 Tax=Streptomyces caniscabiei TaxID=2746961 RepID=A0ABU4MK02_9ACTN|nr:MULTISPECIES: trypsin-like peptidase domain-containing protein [Streptomyces]MBE4738980.1 trypsin-like peptidase domain-containing protein [Streptomyces caniscabiei]MBE4757880.1 trypsin-like peptidase domain-containing protein [Streptomyces caniscabiei]MBE4787541.1 trypsin-like peptidase domain-containing protein [Streptomyces caniscabiei]MBE4794256.1 trypsin-like peptidase domain-containing protein [Streptomyces caniscabiei]MDX2947827.1 trypsin-like peptidase domain-containing protein [Str